MSKPIFTDEMKHAVLSDMVNVFQKQFDLIDETLGLPAGEDDESDLQRTLEAIVKLKTDHNNLLSSLIGLHKVCSIALAGKDGQQHAYFETRSGHFVEASAAMEQAEQAIASSKPTNGCGACGDQCKTRSACRLQDESPAFSNGDAGRWLFIEMLMLLGNVELNQDEDGGYSILLEPAENIAAQHWTGNSPEEVVDIARAAIETTQTGGAA